MSDLRDLAEILTRLDGRGYKAYKEIAGDYDAGGFRLVIDHVQGDPFAEPSRLRALVPPRTARLPDWALSGEARLQATADFLNRSFLESLRTSAEQRVMFGAAEVELSAVEQLVEPAQARAIANAIATARNRIIDDTRTVQAVAAAIIAALEQQGLDAFQPHATGELAAFRAFELAAFLNRIRGLETQPDRGPAG